MPASERKYALDLLSPSRYVATALDRANGTALSERGLVANYRHGLSADLSRVKRNEEGIETDAQATAWVIRQAIDGLAKYLRIEPAGDDRMIGFAEGKDFHSLRYKGRKLHINWDENEQLGDAFNPMSGKFSDGIRKSNGRDNLSELRASMQEFGWLREYPAIKDERGAVLSGQRRLLLAKELGIEPVVITVKLGRGDRADAERFKLAIAGNIGGKPFTPEERREVALAVTGDPEFAFEDIADALRIKQEGVRRDPKLASKGRVGNLKLHDPGPLRHKPTVYTTGALWDSFARVAVNRGLSPSHLLGQYVKAVAEGAEPLLSEGTETPPDE